MEQTMSNEEYEILDHTLHRASGGRYCGDSPAMQRLVAQGLMQSIGFASWCRDEYFGITEAGRAALGAETAERTERRAGKAGKR
jgi:hypothetical protein